MILIVAGISLRAWSIATLGRFFQYWIKIQPGHRVVTGGPYRYAASGSCPGCSDRPGFGVSRVSGLLAAHGTALSAA
jgi:hypothetical protein